MNEKVCPFIPAGGNLSVCLEERCALFCHYSGECAIVTAADILADSTICQNVFPGGELS